MTRQKYNERLRHGTPYVRATQFDRIFRPGLAPNTIIDLYFSTGAVREYDLKLGERVDLFFERHSNTWNMPLLIVKRNGSQLVLSGPKDRYCLYLSITGVVKQLKIPISVKTRLEILDATSNELIIDITNYKSLIVKDKKKKDILSTRVGIDDDAGNKLTFRTRPSLKDRIKIAAKREETPMGRLITDCLERYLELEHPDLNAEQSQDPRLPLQQQ